MTGHKYYFTNVTLISKEHISLRQKYKEGKLIKTFHNRNVKNYLNTPSCVGVNMQTTAHYK